MYQTARVPLVPRRAMHAKGFGSGTKLYRIQHPVLYLEYPLYSIAQTFPPGVRYMLLSALGFALMTATVKLVSTHQIPVLQIVMFRSLVSFALSYADVRRKGISMWGTHKPLLIARGCAGALGLVCVYYAVTTLPLAEATLLQYLHPVFTSVLAFLFLRESIQLSTRACIVLSLLGLLVMVSPNIGAGADSLPWFSIIAALCGAFFSSVAYVIVRRLSRVEDSSVIILYFPMIALPLSILLLGDNFVVPDLEALVLLLLIGVFTQVGQVGLTKAMQTESASKATAYSYIQILLSVLFGWLLFSEVPSLWTWLGGGLIMLGAMINIFWKR